MGDGKQREKQSPGLEAGSPGSESHLGCPQAGGFASSSFSLSSEKRENWLIIIVIVAALFIECFLDASHSPRHSHA